MHPSNGAADDRDQTVEPPRTPVNVAAARYLPVVPAISNAQHPLNYLDVDSGLLNQNFLIIRAGDGTSAFDCPADDASTPFVNGNTWHHQPSS